MLLFSRASARWSLVVLGLIWSQVILAAELPPGKLAQTSAFSATHISSDGDGATASSDRDSVLLKPDELVRRVLQRNAGLSAMRSAVGAVRAKIKPAGALDDPMLSYALAPQTIGGFNTPGGKFRGVNQRIELSQSIPWPGTLDLRSKKASAETESATQKLSDMRLRLAERTRAAYAQWFYVHQAIKINSENQTLVRRLRRVAETAYSSGKAPQQDVLQAEVEFTRLQNDALELIRKRSVVRASINALLNRDPRSPLPRPTDLPPVGVLPDYNSLQQTALNQYPALKGLQAEISAGQDRVALARKGFYPNLKLMASYNTLWDAPQKQFVVGIGINIPIGAKHQGELDMAGARLQQSQAQLLDTRALLLSNVNKAYDTAQQVNSSIALYSRRLLPLARLNLKAAETDYSSGDGDFLKLITAEQQYLMIKLKLARARADYFIQLASLDYQTGGALMQRPAALQNQDATR